MHLKDRIKRILHREYAGERPWKGFIYWWLAANGYEVVKDVNFVDGASDGGIDAVAWPADGRSQNDVLILQSKYFGQAPTEQDLARFRHAVAALQGPLDDFQEWLGGCRDELHRLYRRLREERRRHRYVLIAPCRIRSSQKRSLIKDGIEVHDSDILANLERNFTEGKTPRLEEIRISGASAPRKIAQADGTSVWVFTVPARELGLAFERHGNALFAGNIRYALRGQTARRVRDGIFDTLESHPHELVFSHNGVTVTGDGIGRQHGAAVMRSATIVNGAQTVSYLGSPRVMRRLAWNPARVIVRFIEVDDPELLNDIESKVAFRSNNQNKVDLSDLMIELPSLVSLQRYFRRQGVHLERKKGEQKLRFGELGIAKERLAQVLAAVDSPEGAVKGKSKQELFRSSAHGLFSDYDSSDKARMEAVAWTRVDDTFRATISHLSNRKRRKRAQIAQLASLTVFDRTMRSAGIRSDFFRGMGRWDVHSPGLELFIERSSKTIISALLRISARQKKNEPAFYKAVASVKPAVESAVRHSRVQIRRYFRAYLTN